MSVGMTPMHPCWDEFVGRLCGRLACNHDHSCSVRVLAGMGFDSREIDLSLAYFRQHGGYCDCEACSTSCTAGRWRRELLGGRLRRAAGWHDLPVVRDRP